MTLFSHEFVDLIVEVLDLIVHHQTSCAEEDLNT